MAKRYTDSDKYKKPFLRGLPGAYKLLWDYICNDCNHAGIWIVDEEIAQIYIGRDIKFDLSLAIELFNKDKERVIVFDNNSKWFITTFIEFQYGELNPSNKAHYSVIQILKQYNLINFEGENIRGFQAPTNGANIAPHIYKDKDMDNIDRESMRGEDEDLDFPEEFIPSEKHSSRKSDNNPQLPIRKINQTAQKTQKFFKPTVEEIEAYCIERNNGIDAQRFFDSNEAKGWVVGKTKTPMKDWRAAIRTWEANQRETDGSKMTTMTGVLSLVKKNNSQSIASYEHS